MNFASSIPASVEGLSGAAAHVDPVAGVLLGLAAILIAAKLGGDLAVRIGQPAVLGELIFGVLLGNLGLAGVYWFEPLKTDIFIDMLSKIGVILLLFEVGMESTVGQMMKVGISSSLVALVGVICPFFLGYGVAAWLLPAHSVYVHVFIGATLTATSVGITARVLKDLNQSQSREARIILGAAVIDDVMGLVILAAIAGMIHAADQGGALSVLDISWILAKAVGFLVLAIGLGQLLSIRIFHAAAKLQSQGVLLAVSLSFCFVFAWAAHAIGLAPIVGAFAAGLVLEPSHYDDFVRRKGESLEGWVHPISAFLVPIFFVLMGMRTDLRSFADLSVLGLAAALTGAGIVGKQACAFVSGKGTNRLAVGIGMIPRGEVGLIFGSIGVAMVVKGERVVDTSTFSAIVIMVVVTTLVTPPALKWAFGRRSA